jgi:hypothetical protein
MVSQMTVGLMCFGVNCVKQWCHRARPSPQAAHTNDITSTHHTSKSILVVALAVIGTMTAASSSSHHGRLCSLALSLMVLLGLSQVDSTAAAAFTNGIPDLVQRAFAPKPGLETVYTNAFPGTILDIRLDVADAATKGRMAAQSIILQLQSNQDKDKKAASSQQYLPMPGFNGPHPSSSGGVGGIDIIDCGHFIDLTGRVPLKWSDKASWELIWRQDAPSGSLICGLELQADAVRNHAKLPKGRLYMSFPVWTRDKLNEYQAYKVDWQAASKMHLQERDDQLLKMQQTNNLLAKALHYRNAFAAVEQYSLQPHETMARVPSNNEVIALPNDVLLANKGSLYMKQEGNTFMNPIKQVRLGAAFISMPRDEKGRGSGSTVTNLSNLAP